jgi:hypothetical protein
MQRQPAASADRRVKGLQEAPPGQPPPMTCEMSKSTKSLDNQGLIGGSAPPVKEQPSVQNKHQGSTTSPIHTHGAFVYERV